MSAGRQNKSNCVEWGTPQEYLNLVKDVLGIISLDPCSNDYSLVDAETNFKLPQNDGLKEKWNYKTIFVNPPYGRNSTNKTSIKDWLNKCTEANKTYNSQIIALIPVATNTKHWQDNIFVNSTSVCFLKVSRLKFLKEGKVYEKGAPMSCAIIYWGNDKNKFKSVFKDYGICMDIIRRE